MKNMPLVNIKSHKKLIFIHDVEKEKLRVTQRFSRVNSKSFIENDDRKMLSRIKQFLYLAEIFDFCDE